MQLTESKVFELMGRLHAEVRALTEENERLKATITQHRCPETDAPAAETPAGADEEAPKAPRRKAT